MPVGQPHALITMFVFSITSLEILFFACLYSRQGLTAHDAIYPPSHPP